MSPSLNLHVDYVSQPSRALVLLCHALNAPHNEHLLSFTKGDHKKPEFLRINPFGKVPAVQDGDIRINERLNTTQYSRSFIPAMTRFWNDLPNGTVELEELQKFKLAVNVFMLNRLTCSALRYIASKYDKSGQWYPEDLDVRVKVDEYLDWQHTNTRKHSVGYFYNKILVPVLTQKPVDAQLVNQHKEALGQVEKLFVDYFLASKPFIAGDKMTIADLAAACEFEQPLAGGYDLSHPTREYLKRVQAGLEPRYQEILKDLHDAVKQ